MFIKSLFWNAVLRNTLAIQFAIAFIALLKVFGDGGFGSITLETTFNAFLISIPISFFTGLGIVIYEKRKGVGDV